MRTTWKKAARPARRSQVGACGLLVLLAVVAFWFVRPDHVIDGAIGLHVEEAGSGENARVGDVVYFGIALSADGGGTVDVLSATVVGVPQGLQVVGVYGQQPDDHLRADPGRFIGTDSESAVRAHFPLMRLHPVTDIRLPADGKSPAQWALAIALRATRPGHPRTQGVEVTARQEGHVGTVRAKYQLGLNVYDPHARIDMSKPVSLVEDCPGNEPPTLKSWTQVVRRAVQAGGGAAVMTILADQPSFVWNTSDGSRPTQAAVDGGLVPAIYGRLPFHVDRVIAGTLPTGAVTGLVLGGQLGDDRVGGCSFGIDPPSNGQQLLVVFGPQLPWDTTAPQPVVEIRRLAVIDGSTADTVYGPVHIPDASGG